MLQSYLPDIKLFLKHLLATFLGLLMALGMEQWHEHYRETKWARAFLQQILVDLRQNRIDLKDTLAALAECEANERIFLDRLDQAILARQKGLPPLQVVGPNKIREEFHFSSSAWDAAGASGALRYLPPELLPRLSELFDGFKRITTIQDQTISAPVSQSILFSFHDANWGELAPSEQLRVKEGMRFLLGSNRNWIRVAKSMDKELEGDQKAVEEALRKY